jgi:hypothetical protein
MSFLTLWKGKFKVLESQDYGLTAYPSHSFGAGPSLFPVEIQIKLDLSFSHCSYITDIQ